MSGVEFSAARLMHNATTATGLSDFGDEEFIEPLQVFLRSVTHEGYLGAAGIAGLQADIERHLSNRLRVVADFRRNPQILEEQVEDPIVIIGLPRTGTTKLQRLLACNQELQRLPLWKALHPAPVPGPQGESDFRREIAAGFIDYLRQAAPDFLAVHPMAVDEPEEEMFLQLGSFDGPASWGIFYRALGYVEWVSGRSDLGSYVYLKKQLQYLQWQDGNHHGRPWILKTPMHLGRLDALTKAFPRATLVHCHRHIDNGIASVCRLIDIARKFRGTEHVDQRELGKFVVDYWGEEWRRNLLQRRDLPETVKIIDVHFDDIVRNPLKIVTDIHAAHGLSLPQDFAGRIRDWEMANPPGTPSLPPAQELEKYAVTRAMLNVAFAAYFAEFPNNR